MPEIKVQEVFGKFAIMTEAGVVMFDTKSEAETSLAMVENEAEFTARAAAYCDARGLEAKNAAAKTKIVKDFLAYEASLPAAE